MNLLTLLFRLPLMPLRGFLQLGGGHSTITPNRSSVTRPRSGASLSRPNRRGSPARSQTRTSPTYRARRSAACYLNRRTRSPRRPARSMGELIYLAERRSVRTSRHGDDYDDERAGDVDDELTESRCWPHGSPRRPGQHRRQRDQKV